MSYHANVTAAHQLIDDIMPHVWARRPDVQVKIIGSAPPPDVQALAVRHAPRVMVSGFVPDIRPHLWSATAAVAPMAYGAGIQNKVLEAMACATPVVASTQAVAALDVQPDEEVLLADGGSQTAAALLRLLQDESLRARLGAGGRQYVCRNHNWAHIAQQLQVMYDELLRPPAGHTG
jgi:glycosyltransferase involved in cell wall biosynthesis